MKLSKKKKGFTLIELMAVIAIVAILAAVLVPTVSGYINRSKKTAIITQVRNAVNAVEAYNVASTNPIGDDADVEDLVADDSALITQELLKDTDLNKLNTTVTVKELKIINSDSDAINNMTIDSTSKKFVYDNGTDEAIEIELKEVVEG